MSKTFNSRSKRNFRLGQKCPRCGYKNTRAKLEPYNCNGCKKNSKSRNLICKTCGWSNF